MKSPFYQERGKNNDAALYAPLFSKENISS
jgi:hypothetical protein